MSVFGAIAFNLLINAAFTFVFALGIALAVARLARGFEARVQVSLLVLPFVKVLYDLAQGIPAGSFFWLKLAGAHQELGHFRVGAGVSFCVPMLVLQLAARFHSQLYPQSAADVLASLLAKRVSELAPSVIGGLLCSVAAVLVALRIAGWVAFARRSAQLCAAAERLATRRVGRRTVRVLASRDYTGAPFAAGTFAPYVLFPAALADELSPGAREAIILHELAHHARFDPLLKMVTALLRDLLWFVPGVRSLSRRLERAIEQAADAAAVAGGIDPAWLAAGLVAAGEWLVPSSSASAAIVGTSELSLRVTRLLGQQRPRLSRRARAVQLAVPVLLAASLSLSVFLGNSG